MLTPRILVLSDNQASKAEALAKKLQIEIASLEAPREGLYFEVSDGGIDFLSYLTKPYLRLHIDFARGRIAYRLLQGQKEPLLKAFSDVPRDSYILDATMGFAEDSVRLAVAGHRVLGVERNPYVFTLVEDAIHRFTANNIVLMQGESEVILHEIEEKPYAVYLDPMFGLSKSAKVKKEMQVLQLLTEQDATPPLSSKDLFEVAFANAKVKVVVKRAVNADAISKRKHQSIVTKTIRFDVYRK